MPQWFKMHTFQCKLEYYIFEGSSHKSSFNISVPRLEPLIVIYIFSSIYLQKIQFPESLESNFIYSEVV